jgi:trans-aconitate methyltransferase
VVNRALVKQHLKQATRRTIGEPYVGKRLKLRWLASRLADLDLRPRQILDAGAEDATFSYWLADRWPKATVTAVDIDEEAIAACIAARPASYANRVTFRATAFEALPPDTYDLVTAFDVLEHIVDDKAALVALKDAAKPGAYLLLHVPQPTYTNHRGEAYTWADEDAWQSNPGHVRAGYTLDGLSALVEAAGLEVVSGEWWNRKYAALAHAVYNRLERPTMLRLLSVPVTDVCAVLDRRRPAAEGNTVWVVARKPA